MRSDSKKSRSILLFFLNIISILVNLSYQILLLLLYEVYKYELDCVVRELYIAVDILNGAMSCYRIGSRATKTQLTNQPCAVCCRIQALLNILKNSRPLASRI